MSDSQRWYHHPWCTLMVLMSIYALNIADRYVVSTVLEPIRRDLDLTDASVAFLTGVGLALFYVTVGLFIANVADRANRRNIIVASVAAWSAMTALCGATSTYWQLLVCRVLVGIGEAGGTPPSTSILADTFPPRSRPAALTVFAIGAPVGAWIGSQFAGALAEQFTWRGAFVGLGLPGLLVALIAYVTVREPVRGRFDSGVPAATVTLGEALRWLFADGAARHLILGATVATLWGWGIMWWAPTFLMRSHGLTVGQAGAALGPMHLVAGTAATLLTGFVVSRRFASDSITIGWMLAAVLLVATVPSFLIFEADSQRRVILLLWIVAPAVYFFIGPTLGLLQNIVPPGMRARAVALLLFTANIASLVIAPQTVGLVSDCLAPRVGGNAESLRLALLGLSCVGVWAAIHYWLAARHASRRVIPFERA
jgi:MFS family permease